MASSKLQGRTSTRARRPGPDEALDSLTSRSSLARASHQEPDRTGRPRNGRDVTPEQSPVRGERDVSHARDGPRAASRAGSMGEMRAFPGTRGGTSPVSFRRRLDLRVVWLLGRARRPSSMSAVQLRAPPHYCWRTTCADARDVARSGSRAVPAVRGTNSIVDDRWPTRRRHH